MNHRVEAIDHYQQALKAGRKAHRQKIQRGKYPFLPVLDEILTSNMTSGEFNLGLIEIPADRIVGTKKQRTYKCICFKLYASPSGRQ